MCRMSQMTSSTEAEATGQTKTQKRNEESVMSGKIALGLHVPSVAVVAAGTGSAMKATESDVGVEAGDDSTIGRF